jgi:hypothetical protein
VPPARLVCLLLLAAVGAVLPACATISKCHYGATAVVVLTPTGHYENTPELVAVLDAALKPLGYSAGTKLPIPDKDLYGYSVGAGLHLVPENRVDVRLDVAAGTISIYDYQNYSRSDFVTRTEEAIARGVDTSYRQRLDFKRSAEHSANCAFPLGP